MARIPQRFAILALAAVLVLDLSVAALAQPGEIKGQDVKGDATKSGIDGWSQAPVPREESAAKDAPDPGGGSMSGKGDSPTATSGGSDHSSDDPQKPLEHRTPGPSGHNPASPSK